MFYRVQAQEAERFNDGYTGSVPLTPLRHTAESVRQMAERLGNRATNQRVAGSIPGQVELRFVPWARHFTLLASGRMSLYLLLVALDKSVC